MASDFSVSPEELHDALASKPFLGCGKDQRESLGWVPPLAVRVRDFVLRREPPPIQPQYIQRLKSRKAEVSGQLDQLRTATRFEPPSEAKGAADVTTVLDEAIAKKPAPAAPPALTPEAKPEQESYTERLLKAKKKVWEDREK